MRVGPSDDSPKKLKPPPNYGSRGVQFRLFVLVAMLMLVVTVAMEARDPQRWRWLTDLGTTPVKEEEIDPRLKPQARSNREEPVVSQELPKTRIASTDEASPLDRAWQSGWEEIFPNLTFDDRRFLYAALRTARTGEPLTDSVQSAANESMVHLETAWSSYLRRADESLKGLSEEERTAWREVLSKLQARWSDEVRPLLEKIANQRSVDEADRDRLAELQALLDLQQLAAVQDNTPWRSSETPIWFRLIEQLQASSNQNVKDQSEGVMSYAAIFKQPESHRGKLVTVRGRAEGVYRMSAARDNPCGIDHYWVFWLLPEGGPTSPIVVYSLEKPEGFPSIEFADVGKKKMPSQEDVEFTGYFFKRYAYQGQGGIFTAPLLVARGPIWLKESVSSRQLPSATWFGGVVAGLAIFATGLAAFVYYQYKPGSAREFSERIELP